MEGTGLVEGRSSWTRLIFQAPFQNFLNSLQSALEDHQNHFCEMFFDLRAVPHMCAVLRHNGHPIDARIYVSTITMVFMGACLSDFKGPRPCGKCFTVQLKPKPVPHLSSACQGLFCIDNPQETIIIRVPT